VDYARSLKRDLKSEREHRLTLVAKLQRLELEKRSHVEDISELSALLSTARRDTDAARQQLAEAEHQARQLQATVESLTAELQVGGCRELAGCAGSSPGRFALWRPPLQLSQAV
jgi:chromosome segregation ATPase